MTITKTGGAMALALAVMLGAAATAFGQAAEEMPQGMGPGMMGQGMGPGVMGPGMGQGYGPGPGMMGQMGPGMMAPGMGQGYGPGLMGPGMMGQMGSGMMGQGMGPGMMGQGMMGPGMGQSYGPGPMAPGVMGPAMQGFRVVPTMQLSIDDVQRFLERHISAHGLTHLQVGEVTQTDDETISADIVTREGSLALRLEIDAYTGFVKSVS
ncbi:MAG TPA: hypothetical protein VFZ10_12200 [Geminicoccaceae bacterium]